MVERKRKEVEQKMFTTTISVSQEMHRKLKHLAVDQGVSVRDLIREAIEQYLARSTELEPSNSGSHLG
jgi:predicted transcriptional regulator